MTPNDLVSVILPTFNRAKFLAAAFAAIESQNIRSMEVVVVDDGSVDGTRELVAALSATFPYPIRYVHQENQGAYGARNTGVGLARGEYIAFYDSDDIWLPHHLSACAGALEGNPDVDWVYSSSELINLDSGQVIDPDCFREKGTPRPFMRLAHDRRDALSVITDPGAIKCQIDHGLYCGLQNSVLRRRVFDRLRFEADLRNEAEDQAFAVRALATGFRLAYFDDVHVRYQVHGENSSGAAQGLSLQKLLRVYEPLVEGYRRLEQEVTLSAVERRALKRRIGHELFWHLGYAGYWVAGDRRRAIDMFGRALRVWPWDVAQWKTYVFARLRTAFGAGGQNPAASRPLSR